MIIYGITGDERAASSKSWLSIRGKRDVRKDFLVWYKSFGFFGKLPERGQYHNKYQSFKE